MWSSFRVNAKITPANLWKPIDDIINCSTFICPFESGNCGKEKFEYLKKEKSFFDEKAFFIVFKGLSFGGKMKIW